MRRLEDLLPLHAKGGQVVDVKESAVVDFVSGDAPVRESVMLFAQQFIQQVVSSRLAGRSREPAKLPLEYSRTGPFAAASAVRRRLSASLSAGISTASKAVVFRAASASTSSTTLRSSVHAGPFRHHPNRAGGSVHSLPATGETVRLQYPTEKAPPSNFN